jgi:non-heme chloroperoxidase
MNRRAMFASMALSGVATMFAAPGAASASTAKDALPGPKSNVVTRDGVSLFWREWGRGAPVLFVHSWALQSQMWDYQFTGLSDSMRCIAYDRRGHGRSACPPSGYDYDTLADDLSEVVSALDLTGLTLVGHSMGAAEIVRYLTRHGSARISRIVLLSPVLPFIKKTDDNPNGRPIEVIEAVRAAWRKDFPKWILDNQRPFFVPETSPELMNWGSEMVLQTPLPVALECHRAIVETDFRAELHRIDVPTLLIQGDKDASVPIELTGKPTAALIPRGILKIYEGAPHGLMFTHTERLNSDLRAFVAA